MLRRGWSRVHKRLRFLGCGVRKFGRPTQRLRLAGVNKGADHRLYQGVGIITSYCTATHAVYSTCDTVLYSRSCLIVPCNVLQCVVLYYNTAVVIVIRSLISGMDIVWGPQCVYSACLHRTLQCLLSESRGPQCVTAANHQQTDCCR